MTRHFLAIAILVHVIERREQEKSRDQKAWEDYFIITKRNSMCFFAREKGDIKWERSASAAASEEWSSFSSFWVERERERERRADLFLKMDCLLILSDTLWSLLQHYTWGKSRGESTFSVDDIFNVGDTTTFDTELCDGLDLKNRKR